MIAMAERGFLVIGNAAAGSMDELALEAVLDVLTGDAVTCPVEKPGDIERALAEHPGRIPVVLGGDGTVHAVVAALLAAGELDRRPVGLVPLGTGNDLARSLGIPLDPREAARILAEGQERELDLLVGEDGGIVVNAVHVGVGAEASEHATALKPLLRRAAYAVGALVAGVRSKGRRLRVEVDGKQIADGRRRVLMVGVGNGVSIGGGTPLAPHARPDDGLADVVISYAVSPLARLGFGVLLRRGRHPERADVVTVRGRSVVVEGEPVAANADGELLPPAPRHAWTVRHGAWRMIVPKSS